ncbi:thioredoxin 1 [Nocardia tenerifensis]|uniref:Thioredoxin 1 n=1 Tax=Nocardia tenerifensis TaxID=228006 RepID=A0A318JTV8_9NOCA|nr:thioredoxin family protein [Nocardia tenerifensis]PXX58850.1 thioredoxin 1 [Nocardia tenerifensis]
MPTVTLTPQNYDAVIARHPIVLVEWWADWCGWCTRFAPVYESSAERHTDIVHGTVDAVAEEEMKIRAEISAFPTLMAYREGLLVFNEAGFLAPEALEELVQNIRWMDMDKLRREVAEQMPYDPNGAAAGAGPGAGSRQAGLAAIPNRYGWPGL